MEHSQTKSIGMLVIEDNPADVRLLEMALDHAGLSYRLSVISDGADALALFRQETPNSDMPDLIVLDLNLPKYDGLEVLAVARSNPSFAELPVVVLSSSSSPRERARLDAFTRVRHIMKPPDLDEYLKIGYSIREFFEKSGSQPAYSEP